MARKARAEELDLPGVVPSRQWRSRQTTLALLRAGAELLRTHSLAELSIETLCARIGATVGAFYSRFESKEAYFNALIALALRDGERLLAQPDAAPAELALADRCRALVAGIIGWVRKHEGILRAALQHGDTRPNKWTPFKGLARAATARAVPLLLPAMGKGRESWKKKSIAFGMQVVLGTLVNAILNDPGPLSLHDREIERRLGNCLFLLLEADIGMPARQTARRAASRKG